MCQYIFAYAFYNAGVGANQFFTRHTGLAGNARCNYHHIAAGSLRIIIGAAFKVHSTLGPGLLERPYQVCLANELLKTGLAVHSEVELPVHYNGVTIEVGYRIDILVEKTIIVELKAVQEIAPIHRAQLLSYLKLANLRLGLLINFNTLDLKHGIQRIAN